jgi:hypothetical protein
VSTRRSQAIIQRGEAYHGLFLLYSGLMDWFDFIYKLSLIATLGVLIWYTVETARIREIASKQKDLQLLPAMMFYIKPDSAPDKQILILTNIGYGAAIAVNILPACLKERNDDFEFRFGLANGNDTLRPNEERLINIQFLKNGEEDPNTHRYNEMFMAYYNPENLEWDNLAKSGALGKGKIQDIEAPTQRDICVQFRDISGQRYETKIRFNENGITVAKTPERLE